MCPNQPIPRRKTVVSVNFWWGFAGNETRELSLICGPPVILCVESLKIPFKTLQSVLLCLVMAFLHKNSVLPVKLRVCCTEEGELPRATAGTGGNQVTISRDD
jgi:hypothetical protein